MAAICLVATAQGELAYLAMLLAFAGLVHWEWHRVTTPAKARRQWASFLASVGVIVAFYLGRHDWALGLLLLSALLAILAVIPGPARVFWALLGVCYVVFPIIALLALREDGLDLIIWLLFIIWMSDIGAYLVGSMVGGPRLWRRVSPGKTWSGAIGGTIIGVGCGLFVAVSLFDWAFSTSLVFATLSVSIVGQIGDLAESAWKRHFNVKDSGRIIPGHGGAMDRVDSLITASVALYVYLGLWGGSI